MGTFLFSVCYCSGYLTNISCLLPLIILKIIFYQSVYAFTSLFHLYYHCFLFLIPCMVLLQLKCMHAELLYFTLFLSVLYISGVYTYYTINVSLVTFQVRFHYFPSYYYIFMYTIVYSTYISYILWPLTCV